MILFKDDFQTQNAYIHHNTKNISFLRMYAVLKKMDIKNNAFFLAITQKELMDVDVHKLKDPSPELAARIAYEVAVNPWYGLREVVRIPAQGSAPIQYILNRANLALSWCIFNSISLYLTQCRQTGKTISTIANCSLFMYFITSHYKMCMLAKDNKLRMANVTRLKDIRDTIPSFLINSTVRDKDNAETVTYDERDTSYNSAVAQMSESAADGLGRGLSFPFIHIDEVEYFNNIRTTFPVLRSTMNTVAVQAKAAGLPSCMVMTSTAGRLEDDSCKYALEILDRCMIFTEAIYDEPNIESVRKLLEVNSKNNMIYANFSYLQLGYSKKWLDDITKELNISDPTIIDRDFLGLRKAGSSSSILPISLLNKITESKKEPIKTEITDNGHIVRWYTDLQPILDNKEPLILGLDTSENVGNDFTELYVINGSDMNLVMCTSCNSSSITNLSMYIAKLMVAYPNSVLIPEKRSTGIAYIELIAIELRKHGFNPFTRIFNRVVQHINEDPFNKMPIYDHNAHETELKKYLGFPTSGGGGEYSRLALYKHTLVKTLENNYNRIYDERLISQFGGLDNRAGRIDHGRNGHDDAVIAYLLACWFIYFGKNHHFYSIDASKLLSRVTSAGADIDPIYKQEQLNIKTKLEELKKNMNKTMDSITRNFMIREIKKYESLIDVNVVEEIPITVEQFKKQKPLNMNKPYRNPYSSSIFRV